MATRKSENRPATKLAEASILARTIIEAMDKGQGISRSLRQCERLGELIGDEFMRAYAARALQPGRSTSNRIADLRYVDQHRDAKASGIYQYLKDYQIAGDPLGVQLKRREGIKLPSLEKSVPEAETFVMTARKSMKYTAADKGFTDSVETAEAVLERVRNRLYRYASATLSRLLFASVPEQVLASTRAKVDAELAEKCPQALEKFATAYEELRGSSSENWTNACLAVRRVLLDFADAVYPPREEPVDGRKVGKEEYVNRLWAYAKEHISSDSRREMALAELGDLGSRIDAVYRQSSKGVHAAVERDEAERIIARTYLLIADLL